MSNEYKIEMDFDGNVFKVCPVKKENKIGSFDCLFFCSHNRTKKSIIEKEGFDLVNIICEKSNELPNQSNQLNLIL